MSKQSARTQREHRVLSSFCQAADIPVYPITPILADLCEVTQKDAQAAPPGGLFQALEVFVRVGEKLFRDKPAYTTLWELSDETVGIEDTDSSTKTSETTEDKEAGAVSTAEETVGETNPENEDDHGDACRTPVPQGTIVKPPSSITVGNPAPAPLCGSSSDYPTPPAEVGGGTTPQRQRLPAEILASPLSPKSSPKQRIHSCTLSHSGMRACHGMDKFLPPTPKQKLRAHWLRLRAMAFLLVEIPTQRDTARCTAVSATRRRAKPSVAISLSVSTAKRTGLGLQMRPNRWTSTSTITNQILAGWQILLGSLGSPRSTFVTRLDLMPSNRHHQQSAPAQQQPKLRFRPTSTNHPGRPLW